MRWILRRVAKASTGTLIRSNWERMNKVHMLDSGPRIRRRVLSKALLKFTLLNSNILASLKMVSLTARAIWST